MSCAEANHMKEDQVWKDKEKCQSTTMPFVFSSWTRYNSFCFYYCMKVGWLEHLHVESEKGSMWQVERFIDGCCYNWLVVWLSRSLCTLKLTSKLKDCKKRLGKIVEMTVVCVCVVESAWFSRQLQEKKKKCSSSSANLLSLFSSYSMWLFELLQCIVFSFIAPCVASFISFCILLVTEGTWCCTLGLVDFIVIDVETYPFANTNASFDLTQHKVR